MSWYSAGGYKQLTSSPLILHTRNRGKSGAEIAIKEIGRERYQIISKPYAGYLHLPSAQIKGR